MLSFHSDLQVDLLSGFETYDPISGRHLCSPDSYCAIVHLRKLLRARVTRKSACKSISSRGSVSYREKLKSTKDRKELARLLGFKPSALTSIVYQTPLALKYTTFDIPKKNGGSRTIKAPNPKLKKLQTHLAHLLYSCLTEIEEARQVSPLSYGFRKAGTITANAKNHKGRRYVLNLDLEDFFPTFNFGRVRGYFLKDKAFELEEQVATTIAQIACDGGGATPREPVLSSHFGIDWTDS